LQIPESPRQILIIKKIIPFLNASERSEIIDVNNSDIFEKADSAKALDIATVL
jgi:hypothetical protein